MRFLNARIRCASFGRFDLGTLSSCFFAIRETYNVGIKVSIPTRGWCLVFRTPLGKPEFPVLAQEFGRNEVHDGKQQEETNQKARAWARAPH